MKLARIRALIEQYEQKLIDGILSDEELDSLLDAKTFAQSPEDFDADLQLEGENYSAREAMQIFVLKITSAIGATKLYELINKIIARTISASNPDAFLQQPSLIKYFFAYAKYNQPKDPQSGQDFSDFIELWFAKLNLTKSYQDAVVQSIHHQAIPLEHIKHKEPASLDAIAAEVVTLTTENRRLTALDFGLFTPKTYDIGPFSPIVSLNESGLLEFDPFTIMKATAATFKAKAKATANKIENVIYNFMRYLHLNPTATSSSIQEKFATLGLENNLSVEETIAVFIKLRELLEQHKNLLIPTTIDTNSKTVANIISKDDSDIKQRMTVSKQLFGGIGNIFSSRSSSSTASDNPNAGYIEELDKFIEHYGSTTTQASQFVFHSKDKRTSTGILESIAKTKIATRIKLAFENQESNIPELFTTLLAEYGLANNPDAFFAGTKKKVKLSDALKIFLTGGGKTLGMTLSASGDNQG